jgi:Ferritin-like domain
MREGRTRAGFFEAALLAGGGVAVGGVLIGGLPDLAASKPSAKQDAEILNFALLMEYIQAGLYEAALDGNTLSGEMREFAETVGGQEREHIDFIKGVLGKGARKEPELDFGEDISTPERFANSAFKLEDLGVAAYNTQAPNLTKGALAEAAKIVSVEARHAAWIRAIVGENPAPDASEPPASAKRVISTLDGSGYVQ